MSHNGKPEGSGMGIFLAYLLAFALIVFGLRILHGLVSGPLDTLISWAAAVVYLGLAAGLLYTVFRYVKRKW